MASPITWRNVNSRGASEAANLINAASARIDAGLGDFSDTFKEHSTQQRELFEKDKRANRIAFLEALSGFETEDDLDAAVNSGAIAELKSSFGTLIDPTPLSTDVAGRRSEIRGTTLANQQFQDSQRKWDEEQALRAENPFIEAIRAASLQLGDEANEKALALLEKHKPNLRSSTHNQLTQEHLTRENSERSDKNDQDDRKFLETTRDENLADKKRSEDISSFVTQQVANHEQGGDDTAFTANLVKGLPTRFPKITQEQIREARAITMTALADRLVLAEREQVIKDNAIAAAAVKYGAASNMELLDEGYDAGAATATLMQKLFDINTIFPGRYGEGILQVQPLILQALTRGVEINDPETPGKTTLHKVTPSMIQGLLFGVRQTGFFNSGNNFNELLTDYVLSPAYRETMKNADLYRSEVKSIEADSATKSRGEPAPRGGAVPGTGKNSTDWDEHTEWLATDGKSAMPAPSKSSGSKPAATTEEANIAAKLQRQLEAAESRLHDAVRGGVRSTGVKRTDANKAAQRARLEVELLEEELKKVNLSQAKKLAATRTPEEQRQLNSRLSALQRLSE